MSASDPSSRTDENVNSLRVIKPEHLPKTTNILSEQSDPLFMHGSGQLRLPPPPTDSPRSEWSIFGDQVGRIGPDGLALIC